MSNQPADRLERIALDLTKFIYENAQSDGSPPTKLEILETYVQALKTIGNRQAPASARD